MTENIQLKTVKTYRHICRHHILHTEHLFPFITDYYLVSLCGCVSLCSVLSVWNDLLSCLIEFHARSPKKLNCITLKNKKMKNADSPGNRTALCKRQNLEFGFVLFLLLHIYVML